MLGEGHQVELQVLRVGKEGQQPFASGEIYLTIPMTSQAQQPTLQSASAPPPSPRGQRRRAPEAAL